MTCDTLFDSGTCARVLSGLALSKLEGEGKISMQSYASKYLSDYMGEATTLEELFEIRLPVDEDCQELLSTPIWKAKFTEVGVVSKMERGSKKSAVLCGTASAHVRTLGPLLLGPRRWRAACTTDEWRAQPSLV